MYSSVSPEFPNGLHAQYLRYLAEKLNADLHITPLPFARRVVELKNGHLDLIVGIHHYAAPNDDFIILKPSYESIQNTVFVKQQDQYRLTSLETFKQSTFAVTTRGNYFPELRLEERPKTVSVSTLRQKIGLLEKGRVDGFVHFADSTYKLIDALQTEITIVPALYQPEAQRNYFVGLSKSSKFTARQTEIEQIIISGKRNGDFKHIREAYYSD
ncbi:transporter substrate-binding domain-containing protein [Aliiglaciecola sp. 3_MG-2023]|uniref:substrate-binding periplasmic protein n=1 Tax=Aliiglaciecola sp. 3_MG-2023 TaxID=3062644 RepID=UPI0026E20B5E|nr:transporter substrate-binding domain-containing protein [Aliiglaciecola sp. 3_MG-2023]MDO6692539.1 transporter substrate-binding domain-containing protein [Aliiglaciecola sp. 3_MG-2023]